PEKAPRRGQRFAGGEQLHEQQEGGDAEHELPASLAEFDEHQRRGRSRRENQPSRQVSQQQQSEQADQQQRRSQQVGTPAGASVGGSGRADRAGRHEHQRIFPDVREQYWGQQSVEQAAEHAAQRDPQIKFGQVARVGARAGELAMAHHRDDEKASEMQQQQPDALKDEREDNHQDNQQRLQPQHQAVRQQRAPGKRNDEGRE